MVVGTAMMACFALGFLLAWVVKPQKKEVAGSVRDERTGRFRKRDG